ncbi:MAG: hypothetical protein R3A79_15405 [Nannocystaceae bacterium]
MRRFVRLGLSCGRVAALVAGLALGGSGAEARAAPAAAEGESAGGAETTDAAATAPAAPVEGPRRADVSNGGRCDGAWSIERLDSDERGVLYRACRGGQVSEADLHKTLRRLLGADGWYASSLSWLVGPQRKLRYTWDPALPQGKRQGPPTIDALQRAIDAAMPGFAAGEVCGELSRSDLVRDMIEAASADSELEELPFDSDFLRCLGVDDRLSEGTRLLTVRADGLDSLVVAFGDSRSTLARYFSRDDMLVLGKHRFVVAAVPEGTPVTLIGQHRGQEVPLLWRSVVGRNQAVWMVPVRQACVSLNVRMGEFDRLFVDGQEVQALADTGGRVFVDGKEVPGPDGDRRWRAVDQPMILSRDLPQAVVPDHEIAVLTCLEGKECAIRYLSRIPATTQRPEPRHVCEPFRLDLRPRTQQQVAIIRTSRSPTCERSPLWADDLRDRVRFFFTSDARHRGRREMADVYAYAEIAGALASLEGEIEGGQGKAIGPDRGIDSTEALGTVAKEAWRQGLDILMTFEVQCQPRQDDPDAFTYSLQGTMIGVDEIFGRGFYGDEGLDLDRYIRVETVSFGAPNLQDAALAALLDRLFVVPSSRFIHDFVTTAYRDPTELRVGTVFADDQSVPDSVRVIYKRLSRRRKMLPSPLAEGRKWRPEICDRLSRMSRAEEATMAEVAAIMAGPTGGKVGELNLPLSRTNVDHSVLRRAGIHGRDFEPELPGWYLVARQDKDGTVTDAICLDAHNARDEIFAELTASGGPLMRTATDVSSALARARIGYVTYLRPSLGVGARGGYQFQRNTLNEGVASWQDLNVQSGAITWHRHALTIGPTLEARTRFTASPLEFRARVSPYLDLGLVTIGGVDSSLAEFRTTALTNAFIDVDVGVDVDLVIGYEIGGVQVQHGFLLGLMAVDDSPHETAVNAREGFAGIFGFTLGVGAARRRR